MKIKQEEQELKCIMCGKVNKFDVAEDKILEDGEKIIKHHSVIVYFISPQTKEILCGDCNSINNQIARDKGDNRLGKEKVLTIK